MADFPFRVTRETERALAEAMDRARREYERAARDFNRALEAHLDSGIPAPDSLVAIHRLGKEREQKYRLYREALERFAVFVRTGEAPESRGPANDSQARGAAAGFEGRDSED